MTRIVLISDTHENNLLTKWDIPHGDILIHAGDATARGKPESLGKFGREMLQLPFRFKVYVPGNHDRLFVTQRKLAVNILASCGVITLIDEELMLPPGITIYGTPWQQVNLDDQRMLAMNGYDSFSVLDCSEHFKKIPSDTDILVTHQPAAGMLSLAFDGYELGSTQLASRYQQNLNPKLHVFGHVHEQYGWQWASDAHQTLFVNASLCDPSNRPVNPPIVIEMDEDGTYPVLEV